MTEQGFNPGPMWGVGIGLRGCCGVPGEKDTGPGCGSPVSLSALDVACHCVAPPASHIQLLALGKSPRLSFLPKAGPDQTAHLP